MVTVVPRGKCTRISACIRGAISAYIACSSVSVGIRLQQPRAAEKRPGDKPEKIIELARCYCYVTPVCSRLSDVSLPTRGYCSLNIVVIQLAAGVSAVIHVESVSG